MRQNKYVAERILKGLRLMNYPKGTPLIKEYIYKDLKYLEHKGELDFSDVKVNEHCKDIDDTMCNNIEWVLQQLKNRKFVTQESVDTSIFNNVRPSRVQYRLLIDSSYIIDVITEKSLKLNDILNNQEE